MIPTTDLRVAHLSADTRRYLEMKAEEARHEEARQQHIAAVDRSNAAQLERWREAKVECFLRGEIDKLPPPPRLYPYFI